MLKVTTAAVHQPMRPNTATQNKTPPRLGKGNVTIMLRSFIVYFYCIFLINNILFYSEKREKVDLSSQGIRKKPIRV